MNRKDLQYRLDASRARHCVVSERSVPVASELRASRAAHTGREEQAES